MLEPPSPGPRRPTSDTLASLVDRSLVVSDDWRGSRRYRLLDTIRGYAEERLREAGEEAAVRRRYQDWYLRVLEGSAADMAGDQLPWLRMMDAELENVRAALDWCRAEPATAERALCGSFGIWMAGTHGGTATRRAGVLRSCWRSCQGLRPHPVG
jgi:predicted ATPase